MELHWYPGHMAKASRELKSRLNMVDVVLEIVDARIPKSSRHPQLLHEPGQRGRVLLLAKEDLADPAATEQWIGRLRDDRQPVLAADLRKNTWVRTVRRMLRNVAGERPRTARSGHARVLVAGLPNVGKSTAINSLAGRAKADTGGKPGVTRALQWLSAGEGLQLLDSPGVLWPGVTEGDAALFLAAIGCVPDAVFDNYVAADKLLRLLLRTPGAEVIDRYGKGMAEADEQLVEEVARRRGSLLSGGVPDVERAAAIVLQDFRSGRLGRLTLEWPGEVNDDDTTR